MTNYVLIISTLDDRAPHVWNLIDEAKQVAKVVLVHTKPDTPEVAGTATVRADDIHLHYPAWANRGLDKCNGPTLVINDDILIDAESMSEMFRKLETADLVTLPGRIGTTPITGWCFGLNPNVFRFDDGYRWFYSDDQMWEEAKRDRRKIAVANVAIVHDRGDHPKHPTELRQHVIANKMRFQKTWNRGRAARLR